MRGIVGILGREPVTGPLVDALKRLEYRGYDSAGIATLENGLLAHRRAEGRLRNLEARLARDPLAGTIGGIRPERGALALELLAQLAEILDDPVVDDSNAVGGVADARCFRSVGRGSPSVRGRYPPRSSFIL
jgi:hypothetical protein